MNESIGSAYVPKILGTYELELCDVIEHLIKLRPKKILVIGAAEGYYAVGFARCLPEAKLVCWETSERGRLLQTELFEANGIETDRRTISGFCSMSSLQDLLCCLDDSGSTLIIVDIEGGEALLLDPVMLPQLRNCYLLVEIHEFAINGVEQLLSSRFSTSHSIKCIQARHRTLDDWPAVVRDLVGISSKGAALALMNECRPQGMSWLFMQPNGKQV